MSEGQEGETEIETVKSELTEQSEGCFLSVRARRWEWKRTRKLEVVIKSGGAVWQIER